MFSVALSFAVQPIDNNFSTVKHDLWTHKEWVKEIPEQLRKKKHQKRSYDKEAPTWTFLPHVRRWQVLCFTGRDVSWDFTLTQNPREIQIETDTQLFGDKWQEHRQRQSCASPRATGKVSRTLQPSSWTGRISVSPSAPSVCFTEPHPQH